MSGYVPKILVGRKKCQFIFYAQLRDQCIHCPYLNAIATAMIAQRCSGHVAFPGRWDQRNILKPEQQFAGCLGSAKALQELLQHQPCRNNEITACQRLDQRMNFRPKLLAIAAKRQRPDAGINKQRQSRDRSVL